MLHTRSASHCLLNLLEPCSFKNDRMTGFMWRSSLTRLKWSLLLPCIVSVTNGTWRSSCSLFFHTRAFYARYMAHLRSILACDIYLMAVLVVDLQWILHNRIARYHKSISTGVISERRQMRRGRAAIVDMNRYEIVTGPRRCCKLTGERIMRWSPSYIYRCAACEATSENEPHGGAKRRDTTRSAVARCYSATKTYE